MELIVFLLLLIPITSVIAILTAINARGHASRAREKADELTQRVTFLEVEVHRLRRKQKPARPAGPAPGPRLETPTKAEPFVEKISPPLVPEPEVVLEPP